MQQQFDARNQHMLSQRDLQVTELRARLGDGETLQMTREHQSGTIEMVQGPRMMVFRNHVYVAVGTFSNVPDCPCQ